MKVVYIGRHFVYPLNPEPRNFLDTTALFQWELVEI